MNICICSLVQTMRSAHSSCLPIAIIVVLAGPAPRGGGPQHAVALAPDLLVAGVTALVPALTPPDRDVSCLLIQSDLLD